MFSDFAGVGQSKGSPVQRFHAVAPAAKRGDSTLLQPRANFSPTAHSSGKPPATRSGQYSVAGNNEPRATHLHSDPRHHDYQKRRGVSCDPAAVASSARVRLRSRRAQDFRSPVKHEAAFQLMNSSQFDLLNAAHGGTSP